MPATERIGERACALRRLGRDWSEISRDLGIDLRRVESILGASSGPLPVRTCGCGAKATFEDEDGAVRCFACGKSRARDRDS